MKNIKHYIMLAATLLVASCSQDEELNVPTVCPVEGDLVEITVGAPQEQNSRVSYDDASATPFAWEADDKIILVGFDAKGAYTGQEVFTMKGELPADKKTATFVGKLISGTTHKLYYKAAKLTISTTDGTPSIDYSAQTEDVATPTAHMKDYYLLGTEAIPAADMLNEKAQKTLRLQNSLLRLDVKSTLKLVGAVTSIDVTVNTNTEAPQTATLNISNAAADQAFVAYMLIDPATMAWQQGNNMKVTFKGNGSNAAFVKATATKVTLDKAGMRYKMPIANTEAELKGAKGLCNWEPIPLNTEILVKSTDDLTVKGLTQIEGTDFWRYTNSAGGDVTAVPENFLRIHDTKPLAGVTGVYMPESITSIGSLAFADCRSLTAIRIPESVITIQGGILRDCVALQSVNLPKQLKVLSANTFYNCGNLTSIQLPDGLETIEEQALCNTGLKSLTIPSTVTKVLNSAILANQLTEIRILSTSVSGYVSYAFPKDFYGKNNITLYLMEPVFLTKEGHKWLDITWGEIKLIDGTDSNGLGFDDVNVDNGTMW